MMRILAAIWITAWVTYSASVVGEVLPAKEVSGNLPFNMFLVIGVSMALGFSAAKERK